MFIKIIKILQVVAPIVYIILVMALVLPEISRIQNANMDAGSKSLDTDLTVLAFGFPGSLLVGMLFKILHVDSPMALMICSVIVNAAIIVGLFQLVLYLVRKSSMDNLPNSTPKL